MLPPNRCGKHTAPLAVERSPDSAARSRCQRKISCTKMRPTAVSARGSRASSRRARTAQRAPTVAVAHLGSPHPLNVRRSRTCVAHCRMGTRPASCTQRDKQVFAARAASCSQKAVRQDPALQVLAQLALDVLRQGTLVGLARFCEKRLKVPSDNLVEWCSLGLVPLVAFGRVWR
jgi:hypothetical protein